MNQEEAKAGYEKEWPRLNSMKEYAVRSGDEKAIKRARQLLSALSNKYSDRYVIEPEPPTLEERLKELELRVMHLEETK